MKKIIVILCLLLSMTVPAYAKDVYVCSEKVAASEVKIYAMDETLYIQDKRCGVKIKMVYPSGNWNTSQASYYFDGGWLGRTGERQKYRYVAVSQGSVVAIFDWIMSHR